MIMSTPYEGSGRTRQKTRTRNALVAAARELMAEGLNPTVAAAADRALISHATAYRYFPNQRALLVATNPEVDVESLLGPDAPTDPEARLDALVQALVDRILASEAQLRAMLRLSLEPQPPQTEQLPLRRGRAITWIEDGLSGVRGEISEPAFNRLVLAIRATVGIEALAWLTDVGGLSRDEAAELMRWSARGLLRAALAEATAN
jgi:AcrR family transcriptional regulator